MTLTEGTQAATANRSSTLKGSPDYASTRWEENMARIAEKERELEMLKSEMSSNRWNTCKMSPTRKINDAEEKADVEESKEFLEDFKLVEEQASNNPDGPSK